MSHEYSFKKVKGTKAAVDISWINLFKSIVRYDGRERERESGGGGERGRNKREIAKGVAGRGRDRGRKR